VDLTTAECVASVDGLALTDIRAGTIPDADDIVEGMETGGGAETIDERRFGLAALGEGIQDIAVDKPLAADALALEALLAEIPANLFGRAFEAPGGVADAKERPVVIHT
jgi:hypothetical protein